MSERPSPRHFSPLEAATNRSHEQDLPPPLDEQELLRLLVEALVASAKRRSRVSPVEGGLGITRRSGEAVRHVVVPLSDAKRDLEAESRRSPVPMSTRFSNYGRRATRIMDMDKVDAVIEANFRLGLGPISPKRRDGGKNSVSKL